MPLDLFTGPPRNLFGISCTLLPLGDRHGFRKLRRGEPRSTHTCPKLRYTAIRCKFFCSKDVWPHQNIAILKEKITSFSTKVKRTAAPAAGFPGSNGPTATGRNRLLKSVMLGSLHQACFHKPTSAKERNMEIASNLLHIFPSVWILLFGVWLGMLVDLPICRTTRIHPHPATNSKPSPQWLAVCKS